MNYKLLFIGCFDNFRQFTSCEFFTDELYKRFSKLSHVDIIPLHFNTTTFPEADFALAHCYSNSPAIQNMDVLNSRVKKSAYFMEVANDKFSISYHYDPFYRNFSNSSFINVPVVKEYYDVDSKEPGSILLDHDGERFPWYGDSDLDWNEKIWDFFSKNRDKYPNVWQLERGNVKRPDFIKTVSFTNHQDYLKNTSRFEKFVCTHYGSYNHTAVDMAVRGTKVIVPHVAQRDFVPFGVSSELSMITIYDLEELDVALQQPFRFEPKLDRATDLDEIVAKMDCDFQELMKKQNHKQKKIYFI